MNLSKTIKDKPVIYYILYKSTFLGNIFRLSSWT